MDFSLDGTFATTHFKKWKELRQEFDLNGDGQITLDEVRLSVWPTCYYSDNFVIITVSPWIQENGPLIGLSDSSRYHQRSDHLHMFAGGKCSHIVSSQQIPHLVYIHCSWRHTSMLKYRSFASRHLSGTKGPKENTSIVIHVEVRNLFFN